MTFYSPRESRRRLNRVCHVLYPLWTLYRMLATIFPTVFPDDRFPGGRWIRSQGCYGHYGVDAPTRIP